MSKSSKERSCTKESYLTTVLAYKSSSSHLNIYIVGGAFRAYHIFISNFSVRDARDELWDFLSKQRLSPAF